MINYYTLKGGQGATTIAAAHAVHWAKTRNAECAVLVDDDSEIDDFLAALGQGVTREHPGEALIDLSPVNGWIVVQTRETAMQVNRSNYDICISRQHRAEAVTNVLVTRQCYLALRRAASRPSPDLVVIVGEPGRALDDRSIHAVTNAETHMIEWDPAIPRSVDAGMLASRIPQRLMAAIAAVAAVDRRRQCQEV